ncbi:unnamed protein product [Sphenostylis stenocarpa]|uniref:Uncharacterized protein n=1 Tax=Sphenostylis stenocarpa TaxID=92480 RepID=A0AA86S5Z9_9FABA|nr:unnamed protein product [Sphenostylis stenocarpa]
MNNTKGEETLAYQNGVVSYADLDTNSPSSSANRLQKIAGERVPEREAEEEQSQGL